MAELYIVIANIFPHQILGYCRYLSIYWGMADLGALGHISAELRLQAWTFELPQSHPFHRNVNIDRIGILHQVLSQHDKSHHAKFTQIKSDGSNLVRKRAEKGAETVPKPILAHINILALHRQSGMLSYWAISEHLFIANILVLLVIGLYQFQPLDQTYRQKV